MAEQIRNSVVVKAPVDRVYGLWSNFENFPKFMKNIRSVTRSGPDMSHWVMDGPMGRKWQWDARTTRLEPNRQVAWASTRGDIVTRGQVLFDAQGEQQTEVTVTMQYDLPGGRLVHALAHMVSDPERRLAEDLQRFKSYAESEPPPDSP